MRFYNAGFSDAVAGAKLPVCVGSGVEDSIAAAAPAASHTARTHLFDDGCSASEEARPPTCKRMVAEPVDERTAAVRRSTSRAEQV